MINEDQIRRVREVLGQAYEANDAFNQFFDSDADVKIKSKAGSSPVVLRPSEVLYWFDQEAYEEERIAWNNRSAQVQHSDAIDLLRRHQCLTTFAHLVDAVRRNRVVPFVGAGVSKAMGLPLWAEALSLIAGKLHKFQRTAFDAAMAGFDYLGAAQHLFDHDKVMATNFIKTTFGSCSAAGPVMELHRIGRGCVVTTNFDPALDEVFAQKQKPFDAYMHGSQQGHNFVSRLARGDRCILKLHGTAESPDTHVFTRSQYDSAYGQPFDYTKPLPRILRQIFIGHSLLFVGCSLEQDRTLELFTEAKCGQFEVPDHYAILEEPADADARAQKEHRLLELGIQIFWFPTGKYDYVDKLLGLLADLVEEKLPMRAVRPGRT